MLLNWPTETTDWDMAQSVLDKYIDMNGGEPLGIIEVVISVDDHRVEYQVATWVKELTAIFCEKYGRQQGEIITKKIVSRCLTIGHTIH